MQDSFQGSQRIRLEIFRSEVYFFWLKTVQSANGSAFRASRYHSSYLLD